MNSPLPQTIPSRFVYPSQGFQHYWTEENGKDLLTRTDHTPDKGEIMENLPLLWECDTLADEVIHETYEKMGFQKATALVNAALENGIDQVADAPGSLQKIFKEIEFIPEWLDEDKLRTGAAFCRRTGSLGLIVLRNYCLMGGYESSAINKPLIFTGALKQGAAKRMAETIEFWVDVTGEEALKKGAIGFKAAVKVRLMHAYARTSILKSTDWKNEKWGLPINTWDMVATNLGFSIVFMNGLEQLGFRPTKQEYEGVLHFWKYLGYLMGIPPELLPDTQAEAITSIYKWTMCQSPADEDTRALANALLNEPLLSKYLRFKWQKKILRKIHLGYSHYFLGRRACESMGLPNTLFRYYPYTAKILKPGHEFLSHALPPFYRFTVKLGRKMQLRIKRLFLEGYNSQKKPRF